MGMWAEKMDMDKKITISELFTYDLVACPSFGSSVMSIDKNIYRRYKIGKILSKIKNHSI